MYSESDREALLQLQGTVNSHPTYSEVESHRLTIEIKRNNLEPVWIPRENEGGSGVWDYFHPRATDLQSRIIFTEDFESFVAEYQTKQGLRLIGPVTVAQAVAFIEGTIVDRK